MSRLIGWLGDWDSAFALAVKQNNPVLLYFQLPECIGCMLMAENAFVDKYNQRLIKSSFIPLKLHGDDLPYSEEYGVRWTPHLLICRPDGFPLADAMGHQSPDELGTWLHLGLARHHMHMRQWSSAISNLEIIISLHHQCGSAAQAVFLRGIAGYRLSGDTTHLKNAYIKLSEEYPFSVWHDRAKPYKDF